MFNDLHWACRLTWLDRIRNENVRESLGILNITEKIRKNSLRQFKYAVKTMNAVMVKIIGSIRVVGNQRGGVRPNKKWIEVIRQNMRACRIDKYVVWWWQWQCARMKGYE